MWWNKINPLQAKLAALHEIVHSNGMQVLELHNIGDKQATVEALKKLKMSVLKCRAYW